MKSLQFVIKVYFRHTCCIFGWYQSKVCFSLCIFQWSTKRNIRMEDRKSWCNHSLNRHKPWWMYILERQFLCQFRDYMQVSSPVWTTCGCRYWYTMGACPLVRVAVQSTTSAFVAVLIGPWITTVNKKVLSRLLSMEREMRHWVHVRACTCDQRELTDVLITC